jgi:putative NADPH-quinone reductase
MKTLILVFHPNMSASRGNVHLLEEVENIPDVTVHDLYKTYPDENINVEAEQKLIEGHDRIVFQFPFYWYSAPPLLKKWLEEVITHGWAFGTGGDAFHGKEILNAVTTGVDEEDYAKDGDVKFTVSNLLAPLEAASNFVGATYMAPFTVHGVGHKSDEQLSESAKVYAEYVTGKTQTV